MYVVSPAFLTALRSPSMTMVVRVTTTDGVTLSISDGQVSMDSRRNITRTASLDLIATSTLSLAQVYAKVMTAGVEVLIERGLVLADGSTEYVSLGLFSTDEASIDLSTRGVIRWSGSDRSKKVQRARLTDPYTIPAGTTLATAGTALIISRFPLATVDFSNVTETLASQLVFEAGESSDPWDQARRMFADHGYDLNFSGTGTARAVPIPDPTTSISAFDFGSGDTNLVTGAEASGSFEDVYNGVIATGEGTNVTTPVRAEVWDDNPSSPTYYLGGYGRVPYFYSSPLLTTVAMCQTAATTLLAKLKGRAEQLSWPAIVNPALEPLDVVSVNVQGVTYTLVIDQLTIPLRPADAMSAIARQTVVN